MHGFARRGLIWMLAVAVVVAGLPIAHAMPEMPVRAASMTHQHADTTANGMMMSAGDHAHHHDGMAMDQKSDGDDGGQSSTGPCKCLSCSMCIANFVAPPAPFMTPLRRIVAVTYRIAATDMSGIAVRIDPGIPILAV